jgi:hypothetical protein
MQQGRRQEALMPAYNVRECYEPSIERNARAAASLRRLGYEENADNIDRINANMRAAIDNATLADDLRSIMRSGCVGIDAIVAKKFSGKR